MPTKIEWTNETWNPIVGCSKVSEGCQNCYAEKMAYRLACMEYAKLRKHLRPDLADDAIKNYANVIDYENKKWNGKTAFVESALEKPLHWKKPRMIFVESMGDLFHPSVPFEWVSRVFSKVIFTDDRHIFQILTKHPERAKEYFDNLMYWNGVKIMPNLWLGVTCENQRTADERIPILVQITAVVRFLSLEPLLEDININIHYLRDIKRQGFTGYYDSGWKEPFQWVIIGCESGPGRRPCKLEWVRNIVAQCKAADVPVFVKQLDINGKVEHDMNKFPEDLRIREYPKFEI